MKSVSTAGSSITTPRLSITNPDMFDRVKRAWAVWMLANMPYGNTPDGCFGYDRTGTTDKKMATKRACFKTDYAAGLRRAQIERCDALRVIRSRDMPDTFFYIDPPYVGMDQGHYDGYSQEDFDALLGLIETIRGQFLQSSFRNKSLSDFTGRNGRHTAGTAAILGHDAWQGPERCSG